MIAELFLAEPIPFWKDPTTVSALSTVVIAVATIVYVCFTIGLWLSTRRAANAAMISGDAAKKSAEAAMQSAEIAAQLNRPFMGLVKIDLTNDRNYLTWIIAWAIKNFGTLPAVDVEARLTLKVGPNTRDYDGPSSAEVSPQADIESVARFEFPAATHPAVTTGDQILEARVRIKYATANERRYVYSAQAQYKHDTDSFAILSSKTEPARDGA